jgi:cob(I)alamin adenosyltransferase
VFRRLQNRLFDLGSELTTPDNAVYEGMFRIGDAEGKALEPLRSFVEREILALSRVEPIGEGVFPYVNRLSDLFFVLSRWVGKHLGETEYLWERALQSHARKKRK